ncbi:hypothetical protein [Candidatus Contubernalis alkaliaceticus]|uniref:hypothetical protein n=1 Tax=Candidatus Contubernalis alkaliaceticus TaxID=338645 RepID=UPI001F4BF06A|nr:hypothetical protein [Candidatus Contubernalis alkalaceticus]UNC93647.1 hypothetical protein HUE98_17100 [Candidatus Contubernalis alkalaceticus]
MLTENRNHSFTQPLYIKHVILILLLSIWAATCPTFPSEAVLEFGFTSEFTDIAENIENLAFYGSTLPDGTIYPDVRREPLYPAALFVARSLFKHYTGLVYIQITLLVLTFYMWGVYLYRKYGQLSSIFFVIFLFAAPIPTFYGSVLYPYALNFFFLSSSLLSLISGIQKQKAGYFILSGILCASAVYERGIYLFLPIFIIIVLLLFRKNFNIHTKNLGYYFAAFMLVLAPWLVRNYNHGTVGMNQMMGYTLGYTYGMHPSISESQYSRLFDQYMVQYDDTDKASLKFLNHLMTVEKKSYIEADSILTSLVVEKIRSNPIRVPVTVIKNTLALPARLVDPGIRFTTYETPLDYYLESLTSNTPKLLDFIVFFLSLFGLVYLSRRVDLLAILSLSVLIYTYPFITAITLFDPRYRGVSDIIIYAFASQGLGVMYQTITLKLQKKGSEKKRGMQNEY